jgi:YHS domain-containing protein
MIRSIVITLLLAAAVPAAAQHEQHTAPASTDAQHEHLHQEAGETLFNTRDASGTAWLPDLTPMYGFHRPAAPWEVMLHGNLFIQYLNEGGEEHRRGHQAGSINWFMGMARRPLGRGRFGVRAMVSLEPWTIGGCGYPDLLATGETCDGDTIHDRQHPHDLFMEAAAEYDAPLTSSLRWQLYGGPAGEPALGPAAFPHRLSAMPNLLAPIGHHWLDATHITYGVVTGGIYNRRWKAEASLFNGREPDEDRTDFDLAALDSFSGRLWFIPTGRLALQVSAGRLEEAEAAHGAGGREDVVRMTSSGTYHYPLGGNGFWATTLGWGVNHETEEVTHAFNLETMASLDDANTWFGRVEIAGKPAHDLHVHDSDEVFTVGKLQAGYVRYLRSRHGLQPGFGLSISASMLPAALEHRYGGRVVPGIGLFFTMRPAPHSMGSMAAAAPQPAVPQSAVAPVDPHAGHVMPAAPAAATPPAPPAPAAGPRLPVIEAERVIDPACASTIDLTKAPRATYRGIVYYFCAEDDRNAFVRNPDAYLLRRAP